MKERTKVIVFWVIVLAFSIILSLDELIVFNNPPSFQQLKVSIVFFAGVLTLDSVLLALLGLKRETNLIGRLSSRYTDINSDLLSVALVISAGSGAYALLHFAPGTDFVLMGLGQGNGETAFTCLLSTTFALSAWIFGSAIVLAGRFWKDLKSMWARRPE